MANRAFLLTLLLCLSNIFYLGKADEKLTCNYCNEQKTVNQDTGKETITYIDAENGKELEKCAEKACEEVTDKCYELAHPPPSGEETSTTVHLGCGSDQDKVCEAIETFEVEECKTKFTWKTCDENLCNKGSAKDEDEVKLKCNHCTELVTVKDGETTYTFMEFNTGNKIDKCEEKNCTEDTDKCYKLTTKPSSDEETNTSLHMSCGSTKEEACKAVSKNDDQINVCKADWKWETCTEDLCNKRSKGSALKPMVLTTIVMTVTALFSHQHL